MHRSCNTAGAACKGSFHTHLPGQKRVFHEEVVWATRNKNHVHCVRLDRLRGNAQPLHHKPPEAGQHLQLCRAWGWQHSGHTHTGES
jgi:hypothetical protein